MHSMYLQGFAINLRHMRFAKRTYFRGVALFPVPQNDSGFVRTAIDALSMFREQHPLDIGMDFFLAIWGDIDEVFPHVKICVISSN